MPTPTPADNEINTNFSNRPTEPYIQPISEAPVPATINQVSQAKVIPVAPIKKKSNKKFGRILILLLLVAAIAAGALYYFLIFVPQTNRDYVQKSGEVFNTNTLAFGKYQESVTLPTNQPQDPMVVLESLLRQQKYKDAVTPNLDKAVSEVENLNLNTNEMKKYKAFSLTFLEEYRSLVLKYFDDEKAAFQAQASTAKKNTIKADFFAALRESISKWQTASDYTSSGKSALQKCVDSQKEAKDIYVKMKREHKADNAPPLNTYGF